MYERVGEFINKSAPTNTDGVSMSAAASTPADAANINASAGIVNTASTNAIPNNVAPTTNAAILTQKDITMSDSLVLQPPATDGGAVVSATSTITTNNASIVAPAGQPVAQSQMTSQQTQTTIPSQVNATQASLNASVNMATPNHVSSTANAISIEMKPEPVLPSQQAMSAQPAAPPGTTPDGQQQPVAPTVSTPVMNSAAPSQ